MTAHPTPRPHGGRRLDMLADRGRHAIDLGVNGVGQLLRRGFALALALALAGAPVRLALAGTTTAPPPGAVADAYDATEDQALAVNVIAGVLANDNPGPDSCVTGADATGLAGTVDMQPDGSFTYTPASNFNGVTSFSYGFMLTGDQACSGQADSTAVVTITVKAVNDAPTATPDSFIVLKDRTLIVGVPGVLINDHDVDGDTLAAIKVTNPSHGAVVLASDGSFSYTPASGYTGPDAFSYKASDGSLSSPTRVVSLTVTACTASTDPDAHPHPDGGADAHARGHARAVADAGGLAVDRAKRVAAGVACADHGYLADARRDGAPRAGQRRRRRHPAAGAARDRAVPAAPRVRRRAVRPEVARGAAPRPPARRLSLSPPRRASRSRRASSGSPRACAGSCCRRP